MARNVDRWGVRSLFTNFLCVVTFTSACRTAPLNHGAVKADYGTEFVPNGWVKVTPTDEGSFESFSKAMKSMQFGGPDATGLGVTERTTDQDSTTIEGSTTIGVQAAQGQAQYTNSYKLTTADQTVVQVTGKLGPGAVVSAAATWQPINITMTKEYTIRIWAYGDNPKAPLWQTDAKNPEGYLTLANRTWVSFQCGALVRLISDDLKSIEGSSEVNAAIPGFISFQSVSKVNHASVTTDESIFARTNSSTVINAKDLKGSLIGPTMVEIRKECEAFAKDKLVQTSIDTDIAARAKGWRYTNSSTVCFRDEDCDPWHKGFAGLIVMSTSPRCVQVKKDDKNSYYACQLRAKIGASCTLANASRSAFEYECDKGLTCTPYTTGALWWKQTRGECK